MWPREFMALLDSEAERMVAVIKSPDRIRAVETTNVMDAYENHDDPRIAGDPLVAALPEARKRILEHTPPNADPWMVGYLFATIVQHKLEERFVARLEGNADRTPRPS